MTSIMHSLWVYCPCRFDDIGSCWYLSFFSTKMHKQRWAEPVFLSLYEWAPAANYCFNENRWSATWFRLLLFKAFLFHPAILNFRSIMHGCYRDLGPVHTYPDIFESATFSFRIRKYPRPHVTWSQRIQIEFACPHVFGFTEDWQNCPTRHWFVSNPESSRTVLLSCSSKLVLPVVLCGRQRKELADVKPPSGITYFSI